MNFKEMRARLQAISARMGELAKKETRSADEETELDTLLAEFNDLGPKFERESNIQAAAQRSAGLGESRGRVAGMIDDDGKVVGQGEQSKVDRRSAALRFLQSEEFTDFQKRGGKNSRRVGLELPMDSRSAGIVYRDGDGPIDRRSLVYSGGQPAYMVPADLVPGIFRPNDYDLTMRQVLGSGTTISDTIYFLRELLFTNNAAETAEATSFDVTALGSGGRKPESALTFEEASGAVATIAHWIPVTRQMLADVAQMQGYIENRLLVGLERRLNSQIINGAGGGTNLTGLLNTSGIQTMDEDYFDGLATPIKGVGTDNENFNRILHAIHTGVEFTGYAEATFIAMNPRDIELLQTTVDGNRQYMGGGPFSATGQLRLWGLPVVKERGVTAGTAVVGDGSMAMIWDRQQAEILIDTVNDQFVRNMLTILAELRAGLTVFRPAAFVNVTLAA